MKQKAAPLQFPKRFFWGAATAAHQVEGNTHNQWSVWELEHAKVLAEQAKYRYKHLPKWDQFKTEAQDPQNYISGQAVDHYNRYEEDFKLLKKLNMNAFRFSIEWSRIEPEEGAWNAEAIEHYRVYLQTLKKKGIEPFVTLWHWTMPTWFTDKGGFEKRRNVQYYVRFVEKIIEELGREFRYILTLNEVEVYVAQSYLEGNWPPSKQSKWTSLKVYNNLIRAHKQVYRLCKAASRRFIVGIAANVSHIYPGDDAWLTTKVAGLAQWGLEWMVAGRLKKHLDFIGLNYYFSDRFYGYRIHNPDQKVSDMGFDMQPQDIQFVLQRLYEKYNLPIIVTENGCADADDEYRRWWLTQTLMAMHKALQNGVDLQGYLHWSLLDNFEWAYGFWPRFGLIEVDRKSQTRTIRPSAKWLSQTIAKL
jgi:beta-glucosidase